MDIRQYITEYWNDLWNPNSKVWQYIDRILFILLPLITLRPITLSIPKGGRAVMENMIWVIPLGIWVLFLLLVVPYRLVNKYKRQSDKDNLALKTLKEENTNSEVAKLAHELDTITITLNNIEVSIARLFWGLSDFFTGAYSGGGLNLDDLPQLLSRRFQEHNPNVWTSTRVKLISTLRIKKLIDSESRPVRFGTVNYYVATDSGLEVLDKLKTKGWTEPKLD